MKYFVFSIKLIVILAVFGILNTRYQIPHTVHAEGTSLKIQPSTLQIRAKSPADIRAPFILTNQSLEPVTLQVILKRFRDTGDKTGRVVYSNPDLKTEIDKDAFLRTIELIDDNVAVTRFTLGPKQQKQLELRINLPQDAKNQDHYFTIGFLTVPSEEGSIEESEKNSTFLTVETGIALPVLLSVNQKKEPSGFLDEFTGPLLLQSGPVPFSVVVENTGEHFVEAKGVIFIKNMFGQTVGKIEIPKTNILSGSSRALSGTDTNMTNEEFSNVTWSEKFLLGFYTATLTLVISPDESLYTRNIYFFAFPAVGFVFLFAGLILGFFVIRRIRKKLS